MALKMLIKKSSISKGSKNCFFFNLNRSLVVILLESIAVSLISSRDSKRWFWRKFNAVRCPMIYFSLLYLKCNARSLGLLIRY